jgi:hypothetical protein
VSKIPNFESLDLKPGSASNGENRYHRHEIQDELVTRRIEVVQKICEVVSAECKTAFGNRVISLIVTGSAARGEATIVNSGHGWKLLGDAEFLIVVQNTAESVDARCTDSLKRESERKLRRQGIEVSIDLAVVEASYFKKLPPYIFSYELRVCGRVVSGDPSVLELIPRFTVSDISREDAWRLLCNRMIEQLEFVVDLERSPEQLTPRLHYATVKLYLDMATSYLTFMGCYAPTYRDRAERLAKLAIEPTDDNPFSVSKFAARVAECTSWKLTGDEAGRDSRVELWREAIRYLRRLWRWQMIQMTNERNDSTIAGLSACFARQQKPAQRLRGWISLIKRRGLLKSSPQWPRWIRLASYSTPRYLVYQAAAEVAFRLPCLLKHGDRLAGLNIRWREMRDLLPERAPESKSFPHAVYWELVSDVLWNYSEFLKDTRA